MSDQPFDALEPLPFDRILITGANGFVGRHLLAALRPRLRPTAQLFLTTRSDPDETKGEIGMVLEDKASVDQAVAKAAPDLVIHLAAQASVGESFGDGSSTWAVNLGGSLNLALAVRAHAPGTTFFFASSIEVYGTAFNHGPVTEDSEPRPVSAYGRSKAAAEAMLRDTLPATAKLIIVRPSNHIGPGQSTAFVVSSFASQIMQIEDGLIPPVLKVGNLSAERDIIDVRDIVASYITLLQMSESLPSASVFNIASGKLVTIAAVLDMLRAMSASQTTIEIDPARLRPSDIPRTEVDTRRLQQRFDWEPRYSLETSLGDIMTSLRLQRDQATSATTAGIESSSQENLRGTHRISVQ